MVSTRCFSRESEVSSLPVLPGDSCLLVLAGNPPKLEKSTGGSCDRSCPFVPGAYPFSFAGQWWPVDLWF